MGRTTLISVAAGLLSLMAALPALTGQPSGFLLFYIAGLPIYLAGLALGPAAGTIASLSGFVAATVMGGALLSAVYALIHLVPAWAVVRQAMMQRTTPDGSTGWYPPGSILASLAAMAGTLIALAGFALMAEGTGMSQVISERLSQVLGGIMPDLPEAQRNELVRVYGPLMPASAGSSWVIMAVVSGVIAQGLLTRFGKNLRPRPAYSQITLPDWLSWAMVGAALVSLVFSGELGFLARNLTLVLAVPFLLLGLAVAHQWARSRGHATLILVTLYFFLFLTGWAGLMVVAGVGVVEQWAGLRHRFGGQTNTASGGGTPDDD